MAVAIDKEHREVAKREKLFLFQIMVDGRYAETDRGMSSSSGACSKEFADKLRELIRTYPADAEAISDNSD
jgi:hypothetical protein